MREHAVNHACRQVKALVVRSAKHRDMRTWVPLAIQSLEYLTMEELTEVMMRVYYPELGVRRGR